MMRLIGSRAPTRKEMISHHEYFLQLANTLTQPEQEFEKKYLMQQ